MTIRDLFKDKCTDKPNLFSLLDAAPKIESNLDDFSPSVLQENS